jgi:hypothetical protein
VFTLTWLTGKPTKYAVHVFTATTMVAIVVRARLATREKKFFDMWLIGPDGVQIQGFLS